MSQAINCNYSRTAIRTLCQKELAQCGTARLSHASLENVVKKYNELFSEQRPSMHLTLAVAEKRVRPLLTTFNRRWHPPSQRNVFLTAFSQTNWDHLPSDEKNKHTLRQCSACHTYHLSLNLSFPDKRDQSLLKNELPAISINERDFQTSERRL